MLTRIYIDNFRCFVNFEYKPERKQLLLGANGSGKSSLLDAIRYVKSFIAGDENPFTASTRTRWQDRPLEVIEIDAFLDSREYKYRVEIRFEPETRQVSVNSESLKVSGVPSFELANGRLRFYLDATNQQTAEPPDRTRSALYLSRLSNPYVERFMQWLDSLHCLRIDAYPGEMDENADSGESQPDYELGNFACWYRYLLQAYPAENVNFLTAMKNSMDGFRELRFYSSGGGAEQLRAVFRVAENKLVNYALSELSDGQRYLLGLYLVLHFLISQGRTVFIDEPDNFISLREIQPWLQAAEEAVENHRGQLILISHHPEILNQWAQRHGLRFFREDNGHVRTEKFKVDPNGNLQPAELIARGWENA
ncbi:MAG TPA: AAA family ATPase [Candidatus Dormibacteraeota bacterium]|jgi:predicted ATPase|nr:AAA family ATPase [Candidatus Dormibacteraeota bacterium]